jgi:3-oxoadipate enol-lactonase
MRPALVMVHGFPLDRTMWDGQAPLEAEVDLLRVDLPGFGGAPAPALPSMESYAEAVVAAMDGSGLKRAALCGLSMGGYVLFELRRRYPERISALILADTRAEPDSDEGRRARKQGIQLVREGRRQELLDGFLPKLLTPASLTDPTITGKIRAMGSRISDEGLIAALQAMHDRPDSTPTLATIRVPTLIVVGAHDAVTPLAAATAMQAGIADSRLQEIQGAGHLPPLERPEAFNAAVLELLSGLTAG